MWGATKIDEILNNFEVLLKLENSLLIFTNKYFAKLCSGFSYIQERLLMVSGANNFLSSKSSKTAEIPIFCRWLSRSFRIIQQSWKFPLKFWSLRKCRKILSKTSNKRNCQHWNSSTKTKFQNSLKCQSFKERENIKFTSLAANAFPIFL